MIIRTKKYAASLILIFLFGGMIQVRAQATMGPVEIRCVALDSAGDVTLNWVNPPPNNTWINYEIACSTSSTFTTPPVDTYTITSATLTYTTIPAANLPAAANSNRLYFHMWTNTSIRDTTSDSVSSIFLTATNLGTGVIELQWNSIHTPPLSTSSSWYKIYREDPYLYIWNLVDSTQKLIYYDTITYCKPVKLNYRIEIADSSCISISNISAAGPGLTSEQFDPPQAIMDTTSVNANGSVDISWAKSPKKNIIGYVIYEYFPTYPNPVYLPIDTVSNINSISLINFTKGPHFSDSAIGNPNDSILSFLVAYLDSCGKLGTLSNPQSTLFLKETPDRCKQTNTLTWNAYQNMPGTVNGYGIKYKIWESTNNGNWNVLGTTSWGTRTFIDSNLSTPETRCYFVQVYDSANRDTTASSNRVCYTVATALKPSYDYLRDASVVNYSNEIMVNAYIDTLSNIASDYAGAGYYALQRSSDSIGGFKTIDSIPADHHSNNISFLDNGANPNKQSFRYQIITEDSCYHHIDTTNIGQTMYLTAAGQPDGVNILTWNDYHDWYSNPQYYAIMRSEDGVTYNLVTTIPYRNLGTNSYDDNIKNITVGQGTFYYYIMAFENSSPFPFIDTSYSNIAKAYQDPTVYIPDAFNPKGINRIFIPVGVFIDVTGYDFIILNRWGIVLFESNDPSIGWDGSGKNGKLVEEGVYVYLLTYTSSRGEYFQRKGTVTLLR